MNVLVSAEKRADRIKTRFLYGQRRLKRISSTTTLGGIFLSFFKIGLTGFGGGLAVISQIRTLAVTKRGWFTDHEFAEALALAQSLPGTNAGNVVTYIGLRLRGVKGASTALGAFISPSVILMVGLAILYRHFRQIPDTDKFFIGLNAAVVALIVLHSFKIGRATLQKSWQWALALFSFLAIALLGATTIECVLVAGLVGLYADSYTEQRFKKWRRIRHLADLRRKRLKNQHNFVGGYITRAMAEDRVRKEEMSEDDAFLIAPDTIGDSSDRLHDRIHEGKTKFRSVAIIILVAMPLLAKLSLLLSLAGVFLRIGAVAFGGGFVMVPLIEADVVQKYHWITAQEFADATALGQITPGPLLCTASFIGYRVAGTLGALVATLSVYLPAFVMTSAIGMSLRRFRSNRQVQAFLRGVTPAVVGLLAAAAWSIGRVSINSWTGIFVAITAFIIL
ncbi:MAG: chromate transporter, partial [Pyrinomonadaceae bacterium]